MFEEEDEETDDIVAKKKPAGRRNSMKVLPKSQMVLDCGQRVIGTTTCNECEMVYCVDSAEDVKAHNKFHNELKYRFEIPKLFIDTMLFYNRDMDDYKVYFVGTFTDEKFRKLIDKHLRTINTYLGYVVEDDNLWVMEKRVFLTIMKKDERMLIGGILIIEKLSKAWTHLSEKEIIAEDDVNDWIAGVDRIWVDPEVRLKGVATALLDAATTQDRQMQFRPRRLRVAFSDPTSDGEAIAKRFMETRYTQEHQFDGEFLVY